MTKLLFLTGCVIFLASCGNDQPQVVVRPDIPKDLTRPEPRPECKLATLKDTGICIVDYDQALGKANGKLVAIREITNG